MIWKTKPDFEILKNLSGNTLSDHLGIEYTDFGNDYLTARMPVNEKTVQPFRILHGGASVALAETLGSVAAAMCVGADPKKQVVGVEINANHLSAAREGTWVYGTVRPIRIGRTMQVWNIEIKDERGKLVCISRFTSMVVER